MPDPIPNHIYTGDCLEVMRSWPDACVDHCIADPPFGIASGRGRGRSKRGLGWAFSSHVTMQEAWDQFTEDEYFRFSLDWLREVCRVVKPNGNILVFGTFHNIYLLGFLLGHVLERRILNSIVWFKPNAQPNITARTLTESTEQIVWAVNETPKRAKKWIFNYGIAKELSDGKQMRNYWTLAGSTNVVTAPVVPQKNRTHPAQKPLELVDRLIRFATMPNDLIVDPFAGSGVLALSALRYRRRYVLIETEREYVTAAKSAIRQFPRTTRGKLVRSNGRLATLTDEDLDILTEIPVPQADNLDLVFTVPEYVRRGATTRAQVAKALTYVPRQGPYYADAAIALRLIRLTGPTNRTGQTLEVTPVGMRWLKARGREKRLLQREIVLAAPIIRYVAAQLRVDLGQSPKVKRLTDDLLVAKALQDLDLSPNTAQRRAKTLCGWLSRILQDQTVRTAGAKRR